MFLRKEDLLERGFMLSTTADSGGLGEGGIIRRAQRAFIIYFLASFTKTMFRTIIF